jgi:hypothetical protein
VALWALAAVAAVSTVANQRFFIVIKGWRGRGMVNPFNERMKKFKSTMPGMAPNSSYVESLVCLITES